MHDQGRLREAEHFYAIVLEADERHYGSLCRLGLLCLQQARFEDAARLFRRAVKIDKHSAEAQYYLAVAMTGLQRPQEAMQRYKKALALKPVYPEACNNLGHALQMLGRHEEAIAQYEKAIAIAPAYAEAHNNLGNALQMLGRHQEAIAKYENAIAIRPTYAEAYNNLGNLLGSLSRYEEAITQYKTAFSLRPKYADALYSLGNALGALGRHEEAVTRYEQALDIEPKNAEIRNTFGSLLFTLGQIEQAIAQYKSALDVAPEHAGAHNNLGKALRALGRFDEANHAFEQAIALAPRKGGGYLNLVTSRRLSATDPHFVAMTQLARDMASLDQEDQIELHFALGKVFAGLGDHQLSSRHLLRGNSLKRQKLAYDEPNKLEWFERVRTTFTSELMRDKQGLGDPSCVPVFIIGMPRSGTSLIEQILASHPKVFGAGELRDIGNLAGEIVGADRIEFPEAVAAMSAEQLRDLGTSYLQAIRRLAPAAERVTDKMPGNFSFAGLIHLVLPNARIIHTRRDARDTALSCFSLLFAEGQEYTYDLVELGRYYRTYQALMEHWRSVLPEGVMLEVQYEDVVRDLEAHSRRLIAHCGLEWDDACLAFYKTERSVLTASATQVRQPIYSSSIGRWREYQDLLQPFVQALE